MASTRVSQPIVIWSCPSGSVCTDSQAASQSWIRFGSSSLSSVQPIADQPFSALTSGVVMPRAEMKSTFTKSSDCPGGRAGKSMLQSKFRVRIS